jgi:ParB family chromosome partitioning protein
MKLLNDALDFELFPAPVKATMKENDAVSSDLWKVPRANLRVIPDFNIRVKDSDYDAGIRAMANDMKASGFKPHKPLAGYPALEGDKKIIYITDGHRRLESFDLAVSEGAELDDALPVVLMTKGSNKEDATYELLTTATGVGLTKYEKSVAIKRLSRYGHEPQEIAARLGLKLPEIEDYLLFSSMPKTLQDMVASKKVSFELALNTYKSKGTAAQQTLREAAAAVEQAATGSKSKKSTRVMPKHLPGAALKRAMQKHSAEMFTTLQQVTSDPAFANLAPAVRDEVTKMVAFIRNADTGSTLSATSTGGNVHALNRAAA